MYELDLEPECQLLIENLHCYDCSLSFSDLEAFKSHHHNPSSKAKPSSSAFAIWNPKTTKNVQTRKSTMRNSPQSAKEKEESSASRSSTALVLPSENAETTTSKCIEGEDTIQVYCAKCFGTFQSLSNFLIHLGRHTNNNNNNNNNSNNTNSKSPQLPSSIIMQQLPLRDKNTRHNNINNNKDDSSTCKLKSVPIPGNLKKSPSPTKKIPSVTPSKSTTKEKTKIKSSPVKKMIDEIPIKNIEPEPLEIEMEIKREAIEDSDFDMDIGPNYNDDDFDDVDDIDDPFQPHDSPPQLSPAHLNNNEDENENNDDDNHNNNNEINNSESDEDFIPDDSDDEDFELNPRKRRRTSSSTTTKKREYIGNSTDGFHCKICAKKFPTRFKLRRHEETHEGLQKYACGQPGCDRKYNSWTPMSRHRAVVHGIGKIRHKCEFEGCDKRFFTPSEMKEHSRKQHLQNGDKKIIEDVKKVSSSPAENDNDDDENNSNSNSSAKKNNNRGNNSDNNEMNNNESDEDFIPDDAEDGEINSRKIRQTITSTTTTRGKRFVCGQPGCDKTYGSWTHMARHRVIFHGIGKLRYKCEMEGCEKRFFTPSETKRHSLQSHGQNPEVKFFQNAEEGSFSPAENDNNDDDENNFNILSENEGEKEDELNSNSNFNSSTKKNENEDDDNDDGDNNDEINNNESDEDFVPDDAEDEDFELNPRKRRCTNTTTGKREYVGNSVDGFQCEICAKTFAKRSKLNIHKGTHQGRRPHVCGVPGCDKKYSSWTPMARHRVLVHGIGKLKYQCEKGGCDRRFFTPYEMKKHSCQSGNVEEKLIKKVQKVSSSPAENDDENSIDILSENEEENSDSNSDSNTRKKSRPRKQKSKSGSKRASFSCEAPGCHKKFHSSDSLRRHKVVTHGLAQLKHKCDVEYCGKTFYRPSELRRHLPSHKNDPKEKTFPCTFEDCSSSFVLEKYRAQHILSVHCAGSGEQEEEEGGGNSKSTGSGFYECTHFDCLQKFTTHVELTQHKKVHVGDCKFPCKYCPLVYESPNSRKRHHIKVHRIAELKHKCLLETCDKRFYSPYEMKLHFERHGKEMAPVPAPVAVPVPKEKPICPQCGKQYANNYHLKIHIQVVHDKTKNFLCPHCGCAFGNQGVFSRHLMIHDDIRPHQCDFEGCGKKFRTLSAMKDHKNLHIGVKPHMCSYCGQTFTQSFTLVRHLQTHTGEKPYKCDFPNCDAAFPDLRPLKKHKLTHQQENEEEEAE